MVKVEQIDIELGDNDVDEPSLGSGIAVCWELQPALYDFNNAGYNA